MIREFNKVFLYGNLVMNPSFREATATSQERTYFRMAVNNENKTKEEPWYVDVVCWAGLAKALAEYGEKGMEVMVEGSLETRFVEGIKGLVSHVKATDIKFGAKSKKNRQQPLSSSEQPRTSQDESPDYYGEPDEDDFQNPYEDEEENEEPVAEDVKSLRALADVIGHDNLAELVKNLVAKQVKEQGRSRF